MTGALKYEFMRIRTIRSSYWMSGMAILFSAAITTILAIFVHSAEVDQTDVSQVTTWIITAGASLADHAGARGTLLRRDGVHGDGPRVPLRHQQGDADCHPGPGRRCSRRRP